MSLINGVGSILHVGSHFEWEIKNFSVDCKQVGDFLESPIFVTTCLNTYILWRLTLYPKGGNIESKDYLSLYIECLARGHVISDVIFSVLNDENCKRWGWRMKEKTFDNQKFISWGNSKFVQRHLILDQNNRVLVNDTLKILCEVILNPRHNQLNGNHLEGNSFDYRLEQFNDFEKLLETGNGSDVTFRVDGIEIKAHKAFIISRSPVFQAMFEHQMKEKEENVVDVLDVKYHIMKELLRFMYASKVNNVQANASELLAAADKYSVKGLKVLCEYELSRTITFKSVFELLELAKMHNANFLKAQTIVFIVTNKHSIVEQPEFNKFADLHTDTICEVFRAIVKSS
ncbi:protein roadkill-like [Phymastichus coffea]|uniref:protein roadkill-like n=1 Tax=Phymastichus coffea TaxID=108790 RepID=UPI00273C0D0E|nr:protein roadkill-like [Phymastichus coffea]